jgi:hypothetical protein
MVDKLNIQTEMQAFDRKDRAFYDSLSEQERKKFSPFLMIRWGSAVQGSRELEEYYVIATNERLNRHFFSINTTRHKKLQWLMATSVSPDLGTQRHNWIAPYKRDKTQSTKRRDLARIRPDLDDQELDVLVKITTNQEIREHNRLMGEDV